VAEHKYVNRTQNEEGIFFTVLMTQFIKGLLCLTTCVSWNILLLHTHNIHKLYGHLT